MVSNMNKTVKAAVIGVGNMGSAHAAKLAAGAVRGMELSALCDTDPARLDYCRARFPRVPVFERWEELIDSGCVEAVIIAVPHRLHGEIAGYALEKGLHVLVEKPVDIRISKARRLNEAAERSGRVFAIMFNQRTNFLYAKAREIVQSGALGPLKRSVWIITNWYRTQKYYDSGNWRGSWAGEGGGVLMNQAPHNLDLWQWICGMPQSLIAFCDVGKYHHIEVEDDVTILARYANGATGTFIASTGEYPGTNRLEITGDLGKLVLENGKLKWWRLNMSDRAYSLHGDRSDLQLQADYCELESPQPETAHLGILQNFTNAILYGEELISPGVEGIHELMLSNAAYLSAWNGNALVQLPIDPEAFDRALQERIQGSSFPGKPPSPCKNDAGTYLSRWSIRW